ncbi:hypothetical protein O0880_12400 [Janthinobacterium sp. SUN118]|nr:hypothetical protein [Janthinobacterium sp. SUN118]MDN2710221.1 hypothetical protein [Janthinobacterium sp. SUN118]
MKAKGRQAQQTIESNAPAFQRTPAAFSRSRLISKKKIPPTTNK